MNEYNYSTFGNPNAFYVETLTEKKELKKIGKAAGLCIIGYVIMEYAIALFIERSSFYSVYETDAIFQSCMNIVYSVFGILVPFAIGGKYLRKKTGAEFLKLDKPNNMTHFSLLIGVGFLCCLLANYVTSWIVSFAEMGGIKLTSPEYEVPAGFFGKLIYAISVAVIPPLCEEVAVRGAIMQPLRKYGDRFAIIMSSFIFAILHGNLIQAPFALLAGFVLGYAVCFTESIWTGIAIHFVNNLYSVVIEFIIEGIPDEATQNKVYLIMLIWLYTITGIMTIMFAFKKNHKKLDNKMTYLTSGKKTKAFILNVPMVISILFMLLVTSAYIEFDTGVTTGNLF